MADKKKSIIPTIILSVISIIWIYPIVMILFNSLKVESAITTSGVFQFPTSETWNGIQNFIASVTQMDFLKSFWYSLDPAFCIADNAREMYDSAYDIPEDRAEIL